MMTQPVMVMMTVIRASFVFCSKLCISMALSLLFVEGFRPRGELSVEQVENA